MVLHTCWRSLRYGCMLSDGAEVSVRIALHILTVQQECTSFAKPPTQYNINGSPQNTDRQKADQTYNY